MALDIALFTAIHSIADQWQFLDYAIIFFAEVFPFLVGGSLFILLMRSGYPRLKQLHIFGLTIISAIVARLIAELLRRWIERPRPFITHDFTPLVPEISYSLPSVHAAFFFGFAVAIWLQNRKWGIWFLVAAVIISIARVAAGVHYPSDILVGALLGCVVAFTLAYGMRTFNRKS